MPTPTAPPPELALFLQSWLNLWPTPARDLWHDLAQGRLSSVVYHTKEGRRFAGGSWPAWCYFPNGLVEHWMQHRGDLKQPFFRDLTERYDGYLKGGQIGFVPMLAALLCCWRLGKGVYRIHPRMLESLRETELTPEIPVACLFHLPEWAVLVETPGFTFQGNPIAGFTAYLNSNQPQNEDPALVLHLFKPGPYELGSFPAYTRSLQLTQETLASVTSPRWQRWQRPTCKQTGRNCSPSCPSCCTCAAPTGRFTTPRVGSSSRGTESTGQQEEGNAGLCRREDQHLAGGLADRRCAGSG